MLQNLYSLKDSKVGVFNIPFYKRNAGEAERYVKSVVHEDPAKLPGYYIDVAKYPNQFDLYCLGSFDDETGKISVYDSPQHIISCEAVKLAGQ